MRNLSPSICTSDQHRLVPFFVFLYELFDGEGTGVLLCYVIGAIEELFGGVGFVEFVGSPLV